MRAAAVALSLCLLLSGCRKKTAPEFYRLDGDYSVLVSREGDDAYGTPELTAIIAGLQAIPSDAVERPRAEALLAKIDAEAQRVKKERADTAIAAVPKPTVNPDTLYAGLQQQRVEEAALAAQVLDAGATAKKLEPVKGMSEADFVKQFGECFEAGGTVTLPDGSDASAQRPRDLTACQTRWGVAVWVFGPKGLIGQLVQNKASTSSTETRVLDAGRPAQPAPPPVVETGIVIPGRPAGGTTTPAPSVNQDAYLKDTPPPTVTPPAP